MVCHALAHLCCIFAFWNRLIKMQEYGKRNHFTHRIEKGMGRSATIHNFRCAGYCPHNGVALRG